MCISRPPRIEPAPGAGWTDARVGYSTDRNCMKRSILLVLLLGLLSSAAWANGVSVESLSASGIGVTEATVHGRVASGGVSVSVVVEYGPTPSLGLLIPVTDLPPSASPVNVALKLSGLPSGSVTYFRFKASTGTGSSFGSILSFQTLSQVVVVVGGPPSVVLPGLPPVIGGTFARLAATIDTKGLNTSVYATCQTGNAVPFYSNPQSILATNKPVEVVFEFRDLARNAPYSFDIVAQNVDGAGIGSSTFQTLANVMPTASDSTGYCAPRETAVVPLVFGDADGDALSFEVAAPTRFGTITYLGGRVAYTPGPTYRGDDSFSYIVRDIYGGSARATVRLRNPFLDNFGRYDAAIVADGAPASGLIHIDVDRLGTFTGEMTLDDTRFPLLGSLLPGGRFEGIVAADGRTLRVRLALDPASRILSGRIIEGFRMRQLAAGLPGFQSTAPTPHKGRFTLDFDGPPDLSAGDAHGWAALKVNSRGGARIAGRRVDGVAFLAASALRADDTILLPGARAGRFALFHLTFASTPSYDVIGDIFPYAPPVFDRASSLPSINGSLYLAPADARGALLFADAAMPLVDAEFFAPALSGGGVSAVVEVRADGAFIPDPVLQTGFVSSVDLVTGIFRGTFGAASPRVFNGVFLQKRNVGTGLNYLRAGARQFLDLGLVSLSPR